MQYLKNVKTLLIAQYNKNLQEKLELKFKHFIKYSTQNEFYSLITEPDLNQIQYLTKYQLFDIANYPINKLNQIKQCKLKATFRGRLKSILHHKVIYEYNVINTSSIVEVHVNQVYLIKKINIQVHSNHPTLFIINSFNNIDVIYELKIETDTPKQVCIMNSFNNCFIKTTTLNMFSSIHFKSTKFLSQEFKTTYVSHLNNLTFLPIVERFIMQPMPIYKQKELKIPDDYYFNAVSYIKKKYAKNENSPIYYDFYLNQDEEFRCIQIYNANFHLQFIPHLSKDTKPILH